MSTYYSINQASSTVNVPSCLSHDLCFIGRRTWRHLGLRRRQAEDSFRGLSREFRRRWGCRRLLLGGRYSFVIHTFICDIFNGKILGLFESCSVATKLFEAAFNLEHKNAQFEWVSKLAISRETSMTCLKHFLTVTQPIERWRCQYFCLYMYMYRI